MKETRNFTLPVIGKVQHGEQIIQNGKKRVKEHGYFIAKIQDDSMQIFLNKFNELIKGSKSIDIKFLGDNPFSIKRERYNTGGKVCYCKDNETTGKQKQQNQWKPVECNSNCPYSQKDENGKSACNRIAWLKFLIPEISSNRIWLMKITGQESIDNLDAFFTIQKLQGKQLKDIYTIFLTQKEQQTSKGEKFNNYILDIIEKENFVSNTPIPNQKQEDLSTKTEQIVNNNVVEKKQNTIADVKNTEKEIDKQKQEKDDKTTTTSTISSKKQNKKTKKAEQKPKETEKSKSEESKEENFDNCYALLRTYNENIVNKGQKKEYLIGEFADMNDKICQVAIRPEDADELLECDLGTVVRLDVQDVGNRKFAIKLEFIEKRLKNIAA